MKQPLKWAAQPFYDWLISEGEVSDYPWAGAANTNDYAPGNIGQAKQLFNFSLP